MGVEVDTDASAGQVQAIWRACDQRKGKTMPYTWQNPQSSIRHRARHPTAGKSPPPAASTRRRFSFATDAGRLKGQPTAAWIIAIPRGCLLVPVFEEVFFRGLLLGWLRKQMREDLAVVTMNAFALKSSKTIQPSRHILQRRVVFPQPGVPAIKSRTDHLQTKLLLPGGV
jgi:hypothetical protein